MSGRSRLLPLLIIGLAIAWLTPERLSAQDQTTAADSRVVQISAGMGIDGVRAKSMTDWMTEEAKPADQLGLFATAIEFFVTPEVQVGENWSIGVDYSYLFSSRTIDGSTGRWTFAYQAHLPIAQVHYLLRGTGYWLKAGGGIGYWWANLQEQYVTLGSERDGTASGPGLKLDVVANTAFDDHLFGSIGVEFRAGVLGTFKDRNGSAIQSLGSDVNLNFISAGVKFGLMYQF